MSNRFTPLDIQSFAAQFYANRPVLLVPYDYTVTFTGLTNAQPQNAALAITANADFILTGYRHRATVANAAQNVSTKTAPQVRLMIVDSGSNEQFMSAPVDLENISVNGSDSRDLPFPRMIQGRTSLMISVSNYSAVETYTLDLALEGVLVRALSGT